MILLTGASGYLGRHVLAIVSARGLCCFALRDVDLTNAATAALVMRPLVAAAVIHCAAKVPKRSEDYFDVVASSDSLEMVENLRQHTLAPIVFASSLTAKDGDSPYARSKRTAENLLRERDCGDVILRLPGLFGLPRLNGYVYGAAKQGMIPTPTDPKMHVSDAAEYLVRAATMPSDGNPEPFSVTYGDPRLERVYDSLGVTFEQRVREFAEQLREVPA